MVHTTLIGFTGYKQSGKDTAARFAVEKHGFHRVAYADVLKRVAENIDPLINHEGRPVLLSTFLDWHDWDWDTAKQNSSTRIFLQNLGVAIRQEDPDFWVRAAGVEKALEEHHQVVVTDVRFPNELEHIEALGGTVVRILRPGTGSDRHISETALVGYALPELVNDGDLTYLSHQVWSLINSLGGLSA